MDPDLADGPDLPAAMVEPPGEEWELVAAADVEGAADPIVIDWEELQQELARLWSLSSALKKAEERKDSLAQRLESVIEVRRESLHQTNQLEEMRRKLDARNVALGVLVMCVKKASEGVDGQREQLSQRIRTVLTASKALAEAHNQLKEVNKLSGENACSHLKNMQKMLRMRQQSMVSQVAKLYPVKTSNELAPVQKPDSSSGVTKSGDIGSPSGNISKISQSSTLTILGLQLTTLPIKKASIFTDKKEIQNCATALGYVAHEVSLIASYLDVPLRYPLRLGGSNSYILDYAPSVEATSADSAINPIHTTTNSKLTEFPLFFEGQDTTRAAYAIFLLNKDLEQLLNSIGAESLGPRHILANLKELLRVIQSPGYMHH